MAAGTNLVRHCLDGARLWKRVHSEASVYVGRRGGKGAKSENASILILDFVKWRSRAAPREYGCSFVPCSRIQNSTFRVSFLLFFFSFSRVRASLRGGFVSARRRVLVIVEGRKCIISPQGDLRAAAPASSWLSASSLRRRIEKCSLGADCSRLARQFNAPGG